MHTLNIISTVSEFFLTVQGIYKFIMNSQNLVWVVYWSTKTTKTKSNSFKKRLVETRWAYWYKSFKNNNIHFKEICEVLKVLSSKGDGKFRVIEIGVLEEISSH